MSRNRRRWTAHGGGLLLPSTPPAFQAAGAFTIAVGPVDVPWPAHQSLDVGILLVENANRFTLPDPVGWTLIGANGGGTPDAAGACRIHAFWARAASSSEPVANVLQPAAPTTKQQQGVILTFRGCRATGSPINVTGTFSASSAGTAVSVGGATTTLPWCLIVAAIGNGFSSATGQFGSEANADLSSLATVFNQNDNTIGVGGGIAAATGIKASAGVFGATTGVLANSARHSQGAFALIGT